jgi:hypothetical protein
MSDLNRCVIVTACMVATPHTTLAPPPTHNLVSACFSLFLLAFFCAFAQHALGLDSAAFGPGFEVSNVAKHLAISGEFSDPFSVPTGYTAHVAPIYTVLLALVFKCLGFTDSALLTLLVLNAVLLAIGPTLLPVLSRRVFGHPGAGIAGGILLVFSGKLMPQHEVALSSALLLVTALVLLSHGSLASGLSAAASILTNPVSVLAVAVIGMKRGGSWFAATGGLALLFCLPWIVRNYLLLGAPYFVRDNFGLELYLSNRDQAAPEMSANTGMWQFHPTYNTAEATQVALLGEGAYNRSKLRIALDWIWRHPEHFLSLSARRVVRYWFPSYGAGGWTAYGCQIVNALAIAGVWMARRNSTALLLMGAAIFYSLPYVVIQADLKYGYPMLWVSALLAGNTLHKLSSRIGRALTPGNVPT